ncbi:hypothetical protein BX600DRAFT_439507 [Xylariales sp. PMI_506]|nr:hypothetical protein BX600DRAFT_439507 [Xylariales sp. PMI_506]
MEDGFCDGWKRGCNPGASSLQPSTSRTEIQPMQFAYARAGVPEIEWQLRAVSELAALMLIYTDRRLAYQVDRPWAVSGLAELWSTTARDEYLAGQIGGGPVLQASCGTFA